MLISKSADSKLQKWQEVGHGGYRYGVQECDTFVRCAGRQPPGVIPNFVCIVATSPLEMQKAPASSWSLDLDCPVLYRHTHLTLSPFRFLPVSEPHCRSWMVCKQRESLSLLSFVAPSSYLGVYWSYLERIKLSLKCDALQEMIDLIIAQLDKRPWRSRMFASGFWWLNKQDLLSSSLFSCGSWHRMSSLIDSVMAGIFREGLD